MTIIKDKKYLKSHKKYILDKRLNSEINRISNIENIIINSINLQALVNSPYKNIYYIEQKKGNLKEYYTARINGKMNPCYETYR